MARPRVLFVRAVLSPVGKCIQCGQPFMPPDTLKSVRTHCRDNPGHLVTVHQDTITDYWAAP